MTGFDRNQRPARPGAGNTTAQAASADLGPGKRTLVETVPTTTLPPALRARLERSLATDLSAVRVGVDPRVAAMGARAVASGTEVLFAPGAYQPDSPRGEELIAHEVAHLTQQAEHRVAPTRVVGGLAINDDAGLERDADEIGARVLRGEPARPDGPAAAPSPGPAPLQGWFENLGKLGDLASSLVESASDRWKDAVEPADVKPQGAATGDPVAGSIELQRILEHGTLDTVEAAHEALLVAQRKREVMQELDHVVFGSDEGDYTLDVTPRVADAMIPALQSRKEELAGEAEEDPTWGPFAEKFNKEFGGILHVFGLRRERDDTRQDPVFAARLQFLFTDEQRELLTRYIDSGRLIPDRLFDGDDAGRATAQQRIVMAGQILADGKYRPGSYVQEVHARACFHWARIVYQYAGVATERSTEGLTGSFDVMGGVVLGSGKLEEPFHGKRDPTLDPSAAHLEKNPSAYRFGNASWNRVKDLQPGDWLYIYNGNKSGSGAHSVIFAGWAGEEGVTDDGHHYRKASTFDQGMPDQGGNLHHPVLGDDLFPTPEGTAHPVNDIMRVDPDARPADEVADLTPALSKKVHKKNQAFVQKLLRKHGKDHKTFDHDGFMTWLRAENVKLIERIDAIEGRLTEGQKALFREANASSKETDVICLVQRLFALAANSELLADKMKTTYADDLDVKNAAAMDAYVLETLDMQLQILAQSVEIAALANEADPLRDRLEEIDPASEIKALRSSRRRRQKELYQLSSKHKAERKKKLGEIKAIDAQIAAAKADEKAHRHEIKELHRALDKVEKVERKEMRKLDALVDKLDNLYPHTEYGLVAGASSSGQVKVDLDGRYDHIPIAVTWQDFLVDSGPAG